MPGNDSQTLEEEDIADFADDESSDAETSDINSTRQMMSSMSHQARRRPKSRLFLGDGDMSYSKSVVKKHPAIAAHVTATEYYPIDEINEHHDNTTANVDWLLKHGAQVVFNVDATQLSNPRYGYLDDQGQRIKHVKRIHFCCPYIRESGIPVYERSKTRILVEDFFKQACLLQDDGDQVVMILPKPNSPYENITDQAYCRFYQTHTYGIYDASRQAGYRLIKVRQFDHDRYPGYQHHMTGDNQSVDNAAILREYVFVKTNEAIPKHSPVKHYIYNQWQNCLPELNTDDDSSSYFETDTSSESSGDEAQAVVRETIIRDIAHEFAGMQIKLHVEIDLERPANQADTEAKAACSDEDSGDDQDDQSSVHPLKK